MRVLMEQFSKYPKMFSVENLLSKKENFKRVTKKKFSK